MRKHFSFPIERIPVVIILGSILLYAIPILLEASGDNSWELLSENTDQFRTVFIRSLLFALCSAATCVIFGLIVGIALHRIPLFSRQSKLLSVLFIPFLLGNLSTAFAFKLLLFNTDVKTIAYADNLYLFAIMLIIQIWQYGTIFAYLFWMSIQGIPTHLIEYSEVLRLNSYERFKDVYLAGLKNLILILFLLGFVFSFYEDAKIQLIFKASQGTDSELISYWLYRNYKSHIIINPDYANGQLFGTSMYLILPIAILCFFIFSSFLNKLIIRFTKSTSTFNSKFKKRKEFTGNYIYIFALIVLVVVPIMLVFNKQSLKLTEISQLLTPLYLTAIASLFVTIISIFLFSIPLRLGWQESMKNFNNKSTLLLTVLFVLLLTPPLAIMVTGFEWMINLGLTGEITSKIGWIFGHCILTLPILGSFLIITHFAVKNNELDYLKVFKASRREIVSQSFLRRFPIEYVLTYIFAFSIIWNEAVLNRVFSDRIPSFVSSILRTLSSRNADFSIGMLFFIVSMVIAFLCLLLWNLILDKAKQSLEIKE